MIKAENRASLVQFFQLLVVHHPSRRSASIPLFLCFLLIKNFFFSNLFLCILVRCRKGAAEILVDFSDISGNKESESAGGNGEVRHYDICGKDVPRGYWVGFVSH